REILPAGSENVTRYVERAKYVPPKKEIFSEDQIAQLWQKSDEPLFALALVLIYTGLRLGELMALTPEQASGEFLEIRQSKTAAGVRTVPVHHRIRPLVPAALAWASVRTDRAVRWQWRHVLAPLGLPATAHCARHTCVTRLVEAGVDPRLVRTIVGHAGGSVTDDVYTHVRPEVLLEAIERLP
ncbi:MAG: site-specific integrase, partial [Oscillospiraceae bacterium]|nr:site-specific integrase [Oscillospiraceae bacterium]